MTKEDIIAMAKEAGLYHFEDSEGHCSGVTDAALIDNDKERDDSRLVEILAPFAALVAAQALAQPAAWVGLTDEEITNLHHEIKVRLMGSYKTVDLTAAIETKLKEKNT